jgi:hypothetical protein
MMRQWISFMTGNAKLCKLGANLRVYQVFAEMNRLKSLDIMNIQIAKM